MQYMLLIYANEAAQAALPSEETQAMMAGFHAFTQDIVAKGQFKAGDRLQPVAAATTVRVQNGKTLITDGPFAETREQLGGYYVVEAENLDEAIAIAGRIPTTGIGCVEVRPVFMFS